MPGKNLLGKCSQNLDAGNSVPWSSIAVSWNINLNAPGGGTISRTCTGSKAWVFTRVPYIGGMGSGDLEPEEFAIYRNGCCGDFWDVLFSAEMAGASNYFTPDMVLTRSGCTDVVSGPSGTSINEPLQFFTWQGQYSTGLITSAGAICRMGMLLCRCTPSVTLRVVEDTQPSLDFSGTALSGFSGGSQTLSGPFDTISPLNCSEVNDGGINGSTTLSVTVS